MVAHFFTQVAKTSGTPAQRCLGCSAAAAQQIPFHEWAHGRCPSPRTAQTWEPEGRPLTGGNEVIGWKNGELLQHARGRHEAARSSEYNEALLWWDQERNAVSFGLLARGNLRGATEADLGSSVSTT